MIFDQESGALHHLNATAAVVFRFCDGTATMPQLADDLASVFAVPVDEVEPQVRILVGQLRRANLLVGSARRSASEAS